MSWGREGCLCVCVCGRGRGVICKAHGVGSVTIACFRPERQALTSLSLLGVSTYPRHSSSEIHANTSSIKHPTPSNPSNMIQEKVQSTLEIGSDTSQRNRECGDWTTLFRRGLYWTVWHLAVMLMCYPFRHCVRFPQDTSISGSWWYLQKELQIPPACSSSSAMQCITTKPQRIMQLQSLFVMFCGLDQFHSTF